MPAGDGGALLLAIAIVLTSLLVTSGDETCAKDGQCESSSDGKSKIYAKPDSRWKKYLDKIDAAVADYVECKQDCTCHDSVIEDGLGHWKNGITESEFLSGKDRGVHYQIINHRLFRQEQCNFPARCSGVEHFILSIIKNLGDMELLINVSDGPMSVNFASAMPIFSFSKVLADHWDIMYPAWTFWEGGPAVWPIYPNGLGRWDLMRENLAKKAKEIPWEKKENVGFFRGSRTSSERDPLVLLSRKKPKLVDAQYTKNQAWKSDADTLWREPAEEIPLEDHCKYKYLFNFRGVAASFRLKHLFLCDSLVYHVGEKWQEFFYPALKPWVHYIPLKTDFTEAEAQEIIEFAQENDEVVRHIAERGRKFITDHLRMEDVICYWEKLLKRYSKLLKWKPKRNSRFIRINSKE